MASPLDPVHVMVGLISDQAGRILISRRGAAQHMAGAWEFPGGKKEPGEARLTALRRELAEELGIAVTAAEPLLELFHDYADRRVRLDVWTVHAYTGEPHSREGQPLRWVAVDDLIDAGLLDADRPIVAALLNR
jgi:8-oxo-dGTP diphosphatase